MQYDKRTIELKKFDIDKLDDYRTDSDFDYTIYESKPTIFARIWNWFKRMLTKFFSWLFGADKAVGIVIWILQAIPYIILLIVLLLILKFFLKVNSNSILSGKTEKASVILTEDEEIIKNKDISQLIKKAIADKNYRLAVRYYYLLTLQKLQENELIAWEPQKTNADYINEIKPKEMISKFKDLTHLYDFVWYGNFEINELEFAKVASNFEDLTKRIK